MSRARELELRLQSLEHQLRLLQRITRFMVRDVSLPEVLNEVVQLVVEFMECDSCLLYLIDKGELVLCASNMPHPSAIGKLRLKLDEVLTGIPAARWSCSQRWASRWAVCWNCCAPPIEMPVMWISRCRRRSARCGVDALSVTGAGRDGHRGGAPAANLELLEDQLLLRPRRAEFRHRRPPVSGGASLYRGGGCGGSDEIRSFCRDHLRLRRPLVADPHGRTAFLPVFSERAGRLDGGGEGHLANPRRRFHVEEAARRPR